MGRGHERAAPGKDGGRIRLSKPARNHIARIRLEQLRPALDAGNLIITANNRTRDAILLSCASLQEATAWSQPRVEAIDLWLQQLWDEQAATGKNPFCNYRLLNPVEEHLLWIGIIESDAEQSLLINTQATARLASQAYQLLQQWQLEEEALRGFDGLPDVASFLRWKSRFQKRCEELAVISLADMTGQLQTALAAGELNVPENSLLVNFEHPPPLYQSLLQDMVDHHGATMVYCNSRPQDESETVSPVLVAAQDRRDEIQACVQWIQEQQQANPAGHFAIVSRRHLEYAREIEKAFLDASELSGPGELQGDVCFFNTFQSRFNPNLNEPLRGVLTLLECNRKLITSTDACRILRSGNILPGADTNARVMLEIHLRRYMETSIRVGELRRRMSVEGKSYYCPALAELLKLFDHGKRKAGARPPREWADLFQSQLEAARWPGEDSGTNGRIARQVCESALGNLRRFTAHHGSLELEQALAAMRLLCNTVTAGESFDVNTQVTLANPDECSGLRIDGMWVLGMDDRQWPEAARPNPLLPYTLQQDLGMPRNSADWQRQEAARQYLGLQQACGGSMHCSYSKSDEEQELRPSPLLHGISAIEPVLREYVGQEASVTTLLDCENLPLQAEESVVGGARLLTDQSHCPFRSYAHHRLQAEALPDFSSGPDTMARGILLHTALRVVWERLESSEALHRLNEAEQEELLNEACEIATAELRQDYPETVTPAYAKLEQSRLRELLKTQLQLDRSRPAFTVTHREQELNWNGPGFSLNLQADRIDRLEDGSYFLIDYKSGRGSIDTRKWQGERPEDLQLALYYTSLLDSDITPVTGAAMLQVHVERQQYYGSINSQADTGWLKPLRNRPDWTGLSGDWPATVDSLGREFSEGITRIDPLDPMRSCQYCDLHSLCRIHSDEIQDEAGLYEADDYHE